jgi:hypothetical protein
MTIRDFLIRGAHQRSGRQAVSLKAERSERRDSRRRSRRE